MNDTTKPTEQREQERRQAKAQGRDRRAELLLDAKTKEAARHDQLDGRMDAVSQRLALVERQLATVQQQLAAIQQQLAAAEQRSATPSAANPLTPNT